MRLEHLPLSEWDAALPRSGFEPFHTADALGVLDEHASGELRLFAGYNGQNPVGLLPLFVQQRSVGTVVTSPPPSLGVPRLGPILMPASPKRSKQERLNRRFAAAVVDELGLESSRTLFRIVGNTAYTDPRPYRWREFEITTSFTYRLDVSDSTSEQLLSNCSKSLRREINSVRDLDVTVETEGVEGAQAVYEQTKARYDQQGDRLSMSWEYVRDLFKALDERARNYVVRTPTGEFLSGITVLYSNDAAYFWQGGARGEYNGTTVNSYLHWKIIEDIIEKPPVETVGAYDLVGANTDRFCKYKSKFGASLQPYYTIESSGPQMQLAKRAYQRLSG